MDFLTSPCPWENGYHSFVRAVLVPSAYDNAFFAWKSPLYVCSQLKCFRVQITSELKQEVGDRALRFQYELI